MKRAQSTTPSGKLLLSNRQRKRSVNLRQLRQITLALLGRQSGLQTYELGVQLVTASTMAAINESFLNHKGSTDVITFDYSSRATPQLFGEIFICLHDAVAHARRFHTSWQSELVRYTIHGILHLCGYDDRTPAARCRMKREENRLLRVVAARFPLSRLARRSRVGR